MGDEKVRNRIAEIQAQALDAAEITPELIAKGLFFEATTAQTDSARVTAWKTLAQWRKMVSDRSVGDPPPPRDLKKMIETEFGDNPAICAALLARIPKEEGVDLGNVEPIRGPGV